MFEGDKWYGKGKSRTGYESAGGEGLVILNRALGRGLPEGDIWLKSE